MDGSTAARLILEEPYRHLQDWIYGSHSSIAERIRSESTRRDHPPRRVFPMSCSVILTDGVMRTAIESGCGVMRVRKDNTFRGQGKAR